MENILPDQVIKNAFDQSDIDYFSRFFDSFPEKKRSPYTFISQTSPSQIASSRYHINVYDDHDVMNRLTSRLPHDISKTAKIEVGYLLHSFIPYNIHDDTNYIYYREGEEPYYVFIIPMETVDAKTILFNETSTSEPPKVALDQYTHDKYLSHCDRSRTERLSIRNIFDWEAGSVFMFDIRLLHCSDNYLQNSISEKKCITLMSKRSA
jgi:hypothetical protein